MGYGRQNFRSRQFHLARGWAIHSSQAHQLTKRLYLAERQSIRGVQNKIPRGCYHLWQSYKIRQSDTRIPLSHGLHTETWKKLLADYRDSRLLEYIEFGFPLGYVAKHPQQQNWRIHASATNYPSHVDSYINKEIGFSSLIGSFTDNPCENAHMNPIMTRPKKTGTQRCVILDLSFDPNGASVNEGIPKCALEGEYLKTTLPTPQHLVKEITKMGKHTYMYGFDLACAYRQLRIDPVDWGLMGLYWKGQWFLDKMPAFGIRLGAHYCHVSDRDFSNPLYSYIDDFIGWSASENRAWWAFRQTRQLFRSPSLKESVDKAAQPSTVVMWVGVTFDSDKMTMSIPHEKILQTAQEINTWLNEETIQLRELQKLLRRIFHATKCCQGARLFCNRLLDSLRVTYRCGSTFINAEMKKDLFFI